MGCSGHGSTCIGREQEPSQICISTMTRLFENIAEILHFMVQEAIMVWYFTACLHPAG